MNPRNCHRTRTCSGGSNTEGGGGGGWPEDPPGGRFTPDTIETHDVLVVGNGPSAITLSFMLSGRLPYLDSSSHPIDFLQARLSNLGPEQCLLDVDLEALSQGLSGRSLNRVSVLFDQLMSPNTDFGGGEKSKLRWEYHPERAIDHVVLGTGLPGGLWYSLRKSKTVLTVSRQKWMQLPEMDIPQQHHNSESTEEAEEEEEEEAKENAISPTMRVSFDNIATYYRSYVEHFHLGKYFRNFTRVQRVTWCQGLNCWIVDAISKRCVPIADTTTCKKSKCDSTLNLLKHLRSIAKLRDHHHHHPKPVQYEIKLTRTRFLAKSVVLATGANATSPSLLNIPGEAAPFVMHSLDQLDSVLRSSAKIQRNYLTPLPLCSPPSPSSPPQPSPPTLATLPPQALPTILLVGSGLSSADALLMLADHHKKLHPSQQPPFRIVHIFRRSVSDRSLIFNQLSNEHLYPEYSATFRQMKSSIADARCLPCFLAHPTATYQAYHRTILQHISPERRHRSATVTFLEDAFGESQICIDCGQPLNSVGSTSASFPVSLVLVLIGSKPELDFLPSPLVAKLGLQSNQPLDIRSNPVRINTVTHEALAARNLYAIGPLVGDNFVRFVQGGAVAVAADLARKRKDRSLTAVESAVRTIPNTGCDLN